MNQETTTFRSCKLKDDVNRQGFHTKPFPNSLRAELVAHIENRIRTMASEFNQAQAFERPLHEIALGVDDAIWMDKMHRANRMFPDDLAHKIHDWAAATILPELGKTRSAVNVVMPQELSINPHLRPDSWAVYWRCVRPGKPDAGRPHRDSTFWEIEREEGYDPCLPFEFNYLKDCLKIWIPLSGCTPDTTLQVIPGSHLIDLPTTVTMTEYGRRPTISDEWLKSNSHLFVSPIELSHGSCILFDLNLVHRGPSHAADELRISAEFNFIFS